MDETVEERRPKRQKRESKANKFEKFKQIKSGNRSKYEIEEVEDLYETIDEKEYAKRVLYRQDDDFIVDDDGSGYADDGREIFDDDVDDEYVTPNKSKGVKRKKKAVSENAGKGNIQAMLSKMPVKKKEEEKVDDDGMLSELLSEIDNPADNNILKQKNDSIKTVLAHRKAEKDYIKSFIGPPKRISIKKKSFVGTVSNNITSDEANNSNDLVNESMSEPIEEKNNMDCKQNDKDSMETDSQTITWEESPTEETEKINIDDSTQQDEDLGTDFFDNDIDFSHIEELENQNETTADLETVEDTILNQFMDQQGAIPDQSVLSEFTDDMEDSSTQDDQDKDVFRFFYWDAYENPFVQPGVIFLFGKTYCKKSKTYVSCCVTVKEVNRRIFVLPRSYKLDEKGNETEEPVTHKDIYDEFSVIMKELKVNRFKCRFVRKKNCFAPGVPVESDYMEVKYGGNFSPIPVSFKTGKTYSKMFGLNSSFLEIFLLERKIKGPCWLDVVNYEIVKNPVTWCKLEILVNKDTDVNFSKLEKPLPPPPLTVAAINIKYTFDQKRHENKIVMISCLSHNRYFVDKPPPNPPFQSDICIFTSPKDVPLPADLYKCLMTFKRTKIQKMDSENAMLNFFMNHFQSIDPDLIVGHDLSGHQISLLASRLYLNKNENFSKLGKIKRKGVHNRIEKVLFTGRLVCDMKIAAKESIRSRAYDLGTLCQNILGIKEDQRIQLEPEDIEKMFNHSNNIMKLIVLTMNDTSYILKMMYSLNTIPLALQITNIAGNIMSRTLMGGRAERNEFLLLHAFSEKDYIVPDKQIKLKDENTSSSKKKPAYSGGLVLEPKVGFYDKLILLMDFNSLYPSIIQEYNICFTTLPQHESDDLILPDKDLPMGILPIEIRKLVESRREVKKLMKSVDKKTDQYLQYNIRQMALKLTANSMYGCLGFSHSRFFGKGLAALVTHKGREILTNTQQLVQKMNYEVVYGDTDSIMINTNITDFEQVNKIGSKIKQEVNKLYKQVELDIDGVFKYLLLLKKKKYAAVTITKMDNGKLKVEKEYKGLDIVRRDWSQIACETGKIVLEHILSDVEERIESICDQLKKIKEDFEQDKVPLSLLVITKQLTKDPKNYQDKNNLPHVNVALRCNRNGAHFRVGDTVPYVICNDGTNNNPVQRAYHLEELKNNPNLKIDVNYYLSQQIHPVVTRICAPFEEINAFKIADCLGIDTSSFKKPVANKEMAVDIFAKPEIKFKNVDPFTFKCLACNEPNDITGPFRYNIAVLEKCSNTNCSACPADNIPYIQNQLILTIRKFISKYYLNELTCEDPACNNDICRIPSRFSGKFPVCTLCKNGIMYKKYTEGDLYFQLSYFSHIFDPSKTGKKYALHKAVDDGYCSLRETVEKYINQSGYSVVNLTELFSGFLIRDDKKSLNL